MVKLTPAQEWALRAIADGKGTSPARLGQEMMERPGAADHRGGTPYKAQGYGRMGGAMMARLERMGLVRTSCQGRFGWQPTQAVITDKGRAALAETF